MKRILTCVTTSCLPAGLEIAGDRGEVEAEMPPVRRGGVTSSSDQYNNNKNEKPGQAEILMGLSLLERQAQERGYGTGGSSMRIGKGEII